MQGAVHILNRSGDTTLEWSTEEDTKLSPEEVEKEFNRLVDEGHLAFNTEGGVSEQIKTFDPETHSKVTILPQFVGG